MKPEREEKEWHERYTLCGNICPTETEEYVVVKDNIKKRLFNLTCQEAYIWHYVNERGKILENKEEYVQIKGLDQKVVDKTLRKLVRLGIAGSEEIRLAGKILGNSENHGEQMARRGRQTRDNLVSNKGRNEQRKGENITEKLDIWLIKIDRPRIIGVILNRQIGNIVLGKSYRIACIGLASLGLITLWRNVGLLFYDLQNAGNQDIVTLVTISLLVDANRIVVKLAGASAGWRYGQEIKEAGYALYFGIIPSVLIKFTERSMASKLRLRISTACILTRCGLAGIIIIGWFVSREHQSDMSRLLSLGIVASIGGLLMEANPLWPSDGYDAITAWAGVGNVYKKGFQLVALGKRIRGVDEAMTRRQRKRLYVGSIIGMMAIGIVMVFSVTLIATGLAAAIGKEVLGNGAQEVIITAFMLAMGWRVYRITRSELKSRGRPGGTSLLECE